MDKYIKLDTAKKTLLDYIYEFDASRANPDLVRGIIYAREWIDRVPLEDVTEVVHGRWVFDGDDYFCNRCNRNALCDKMTGEEVLSVNCPHCGSKMDGYKNK